MDLKNMRVRIINIVLSEYGPPKGIVLNEYGPPKGKARPTRPKRGNISI